MILATFPSVKPLIPMNHDINVDEDSWLDEELSDNVVLARNASHEWEQLSSKFSDVRFH